MEDNFEKPYRFALLSYSAQLEKMIREYANGPGYTIDYLPLQYGKPGMGACDALNSGYEVCLLYTSYAFSVMEEAGGNVVDINKSDMDRARALLNAGSHAKTIGLPIQKRERVDVRLLEKLCDVSVHPIIFETLADLGDGIRTSLANGIKTFVGGGLVDSICRENPPARCMPVLPEVSSLLDAIEKAINIARHKRIEQTRHDQLLSIFSLYKDGVAYFTGDGKCAYSNSIALNLLNRKSERELDGASLEISNPALWEAMRVDEILKGGAPSIEQLVRLNHQDLVISAMPVAAHSSPGVAVFVRDADSVHNDAGRVRAIQSKHSGFQAHCLVGDIKGKAPVMVQLRRSIKLYAAHDAPVLIHGETGTGKDIAAQSLHNAGSRARAPFVAVNCAALPDTLLESELFGYEEGAFTGAKKGGKPGLFEMAHTGTLFLDEMGELSPATQLRLLRVLENKEIIRIGGNRLIPIDIRVISASHKSLPELVRAGKFRADLFYRLAVLRLEIPPLRHRVADIPLLIEPILRNYGRDSSCLTEGIIEAMRQYHWPGNIRELRAVMENYLVMLGGAPADEALFCGILADWARDTVPASSEFQWTVGSGDLKTQLDETRRRIVQETMARCGFNKKKAAMSLGISYHTLWRILGSAEDGEGAGVLADPNVLAAGVADPGM